MDVIQIPDKQFLETMTTIDLYLDNFVGKKVQIEGFVYKEQGISANQFVVSRFAMQCCSADALPVGMLAEYDRAKQFVADEWVRVTGTVQKTKYFDNEKKDRQAILMGRRRSSYLPKSLKALKC